VPAAVPRLLFDENLSARLVAAVADVYPGSSVLLGPPPKVVWVRLGNCTTADVARQLRVRRDDIARFAEHEDAAFLALG
jgi:predicted nuclease of predicted toxin-antitoxin system